MSDKIIQFDDAMFESKLDALVRIKVEQTINAMLDENIVLRKAHGLYAITDPFVHQAWKESRAVQARLQG